MRFIEELFEAQSLALIFFFAFCGAVLMYVSADRRLDECRYWSAEVYERLPPSARRELDEEWGVHRDMLEDMADRPSR